MIRAYVASLVLLIGLASPAFANPRVTWKVLSPTVVAAPGKTAMVKVQATLLPKNHVYSTKTYPNDEGPTSTTITVGDAPMFSLGGRVRPSKAPTVKYDDAFEVETEYWEGTVTFTVPVKIAPNATPGSTQRGWVSFYYQTCDTISCMPPEEEKLPFVLSVAAGDTASDSSTAAIDSASGADSASTSFLDTAAGPTLTSPPARAGKAEIDAMGSTEEIAQAEQKGLLSYLGLAALAGALALMTPCVFPMIPITVSFFTKRTQATRGSAIRDASVYSLGIILTFTAIGFLFAILLGASGINAFAANPWVNLVIAAVFVILALSLFGLYEIQIPTSLLNKLNRKAQGEGESFGGVLLMGLLFTLTSFTCTVPFIGGLMVSATATGKWLYPLMGMAVFATVFATPFFLLALFPAALKSMPKSGGWLNAVKVVMGFVELAAAMKFLSNADLVWTWGILTREAFLAIWIAIAVLTTIYLLGRFQLPHDTPVESVGPVRMLFAVGSLSVAFWLLTGVFGGSLGEIDALAPPQEYPGRGNTSPLAAFASFGSGGGQAQSPETTWIIDDYPKALAASRQSGKPMFVDFTGYTCTNCRWMEKNMFGRRDVAELMKKYVLVRLYTDRRDSANLAHRKMQETRFETIALPFYAVISSTDSVVSTFPGMTRKPEQFVAFLEHSLGPVAVAGTGTTRE